MKKASPVRLSLRKLFIAMLAVGPISILPSPLLAAVPATMPFTVVNGGAAVTWTGLGTVGTVNAPDRSILAWNQGAFTIAAGETFSFIVPSGGSILNKVGYGTTGSTIGATDTATINGTLNSTGRVFVLANGSIQVGGGATINASGGLVLSTLTETDNFAFATSGNLALSGASTGNIQIGGTNLAGGTTGLVQIGTNLSAYGSLVTTANLSVQGDLIVNQKSAGAPLVLVGDGGGLVVNGNLSVTSNNGNIGQGTQPLSVTGNSTFVAGTADIGLSQGGNNFTTVYATGGSLSLVDVNSIVLGNITTTATATPGSGGLNITALNDISTIGTVVVGGSAGLVSTSTAPMTGNITFANNSSVVGSVSTLASGNTTLNVLGNLTTNFVNFGQVANTSSSVLDFTSAGTLSVANAIIASSATLKGASITSTGGSLSLSGPAVFVASTGSIVLPTVNALRVEATASNGSISQAPLSVLTTVAGASAFNAGPAGVITLTGANKFAFTAPVVLNGASASITNADNITIGATNLSGNLTVSTLQTGVVGASPGNVTFGAGLGTAAQDINIGGSLNVFTNGGNIVEDQASTNNIFGSLNLNASPNGISALGTGTVNFTAASAGVTGGGRYGQFNVTANTVNLAENTSLNLGTIYASAVTVNSTAGDILINGTITANTVSGNANAGSILQGPAGVLTLGTGTSVFRASNSFGTNLSSAGNNFGGPVTLTNGLNNIIVSGSGFTLSGATSVTAGNSTTTINTVGNVLLTNGSNTTRTVVNSGGNIVVNGGLYNTLSLTANDTSATSITQTNIVGGGNNTATTLTVNGTLTVSSLGNVSLATATNNLTGPVVINNTVGDTSVYSSRNLSISGMSTGNVIAVAGTVGAFSNAWNLVLGNLTAKGLSGGAMNGNTIITGNTVSTPFINGNLTGGNPISGSSGTITQLPGTSVHVENNLDLMTYNQSIQVQNAGNSFGRVQASTSGGNPNGVGVGDILITEDSTLKVGSIMVGGNIILTSRFGSVIEDPAANVVLTANGPTSVLTVSAPSGSIQLGGLNRTTGTTTGNIIAANLTAAGSAQIQSSGNLTLGSVSANSLSVTANNIAQSAPLNIFGLSSFSTNTGTASGGISLTNAGNNFGPLSLTVSSPGASIAVNEGSTLNLRTVNMMSASSNGTFSGTSASGDVIDTGLGGAKLGAPFGSGVVTLAAVNGNITIDDPTSDIITTGGLVFNANNVTLSVLGSVGSTLVLGAANTPSVATGNLIASSALGNLGNAGPLAVGGNAFFQTGNGNITIGLNGNIGFGSLKFIGNQVSISETGNMDIQTGSTAFGPANLISGGSISIVDIGGGPVTFGNLVNMSATGNITLSKVQAVGNLTVSATGTKNLSALSVTTDLNGRAPTFNGTGSNVDPAP